MTKIWEVVAVEREGRAIRLTMKNASRHPLAFMMNAPGLYHVPYQERNAVEAHALTPVQTNPGETVVIEFRLSRDPETFRKTSRVRFTVLDGGGLRADYAVHVQA